MARLWYKLTEPSPLVTDGEQRRRARLLSGILVAVLPVSLLAAFLVPLVTDPGPGGRLSDPVALTGLTACLGGLVVYGLSRTRHTRLAAVATVLLAVYGTWGAVFATIDTPQRVSAPYFVSLSVLLAASLLPMVFTAVLAVANIVGLLALPSFSALVAPIDMVYPVVFTLFTSALMVAFAVVRNADLEQIRSYVVKVEESNQELEQFAHIASHDLQEPLRHVASYAQLLQRRYGDQLDAEGHLYVEYAVEGTQRMRSLIQDLLTYAKVGKEGRPLEPTCAQAALDEAMANLGASLETEGARIEAATLPTVLCEPGGLSRIFQNLVGNAVKFRDEQPPEVHITASPEGRFHRFSVQDNGIGFDEAYADRIFTAFQRLHGQDRYPGTGIGLAICQRIVDQAGGRIWVESQPGQGSTFHFTLPAVG